MIDILAGPAAWWALAVGLASAVGAGVSYARAARRARATPAPTLRETPLDMPRIAPGKPVERGVRGSLATVPLPSLMHVLEQERRSGALSVWGPHVVGSILWRSGRLVAASFELRRVEHGEAAIRALLDVRDGVFDFEPRNVPGAGDMGRSVQAILLDAAVSADEKEIACAGLTTLSDGVP